MLLGQRRAKCLQILLSNSQSGQAEQGKKNRKLRVMLSKKILPQYAEELKGNEIAFTVFLSAIADVYLLFRTTDHRIHSQAPPLTISVGRIILSYSFMIAANNKQLRSLGASTRFRLKGAL